MNHFRFCNFGEMTVIPAEEVTFFTYAESAHLTGYFKTEMVGEYLLMKELITF